MLKKHFQKSGKSYKELSSKFNLIIKPNTEEKVSLKRFCEEKAHATIKVQTRIKPESSDFPEMREHLTARNVFKNHVQI